MTQIAPGLPVLHRRAREPGPGAVRHHGVRRTVVVSFDSPLSRWASSPAASWCTPIPVTPLCRRRSRAQGDRRPVRRRALAPVAGTPLLRTPLGALGMPRAQRSPRVFDASMMQARLYSHSYHPAPGSSPSCCRRSPAWWSGVPPQRRRSRPRAPPPRATLRSRRDARDLGARSPSTSAQRRGPLRAPQVQPPASAYPSRDPDLPRRPPDHQRATGPPRRSDPRHRGPPRRQHHGHRQPLTPPPASSPIPSAPSPRRPACRGSPRSLAVADPHTTVKPVSCAREPILERGVRAAWRGGILVRDHGRYTRARRGRARPEPRERWDGCT